MSETIAAAVAALKKKLPDGFDGVAKFVISGEGTILMDASGARAEDGEAEVSLIASAETFRGILSGEVNPTVAFMTGKLQVEGDMGAAIRLGSMLA